MDADAHAVNPPKLPLLVAELRNQVRRYSRKYDLFQPGALVVGVSGGVDSLVLLHLLRDLGSDFQLQVHVATLDHGLRGAEGAADAAFVRQLAESWQFPVTVGQVDVSALAKSQQIGIEDAARQARYRFLQQIAGQVGAEQIAVAHQRDDQAETVLMHVLRGSGLTGLRGMVPRHRLDGLALVRPLLDMPRASIEAYAAACGLNARLDSSNADPRYTRNRLRLDILPLLRTVNPALDSALAHSAELAQADYEALLWTLRTHLPDWPLSADRAAFAALPRGLQRFAVHQLTPEWRFEQVETLVDWLAAATPGDLYALPERLTLLVGIDRLQCATIDELALLVAIQCPALSTAQPCPVPLPGVIDLPGGWRLHTELKTGSDSDWRNPLTTVLHVPPGAVLQLRVRQTGDRFAPKGLHGHQQKLSDTLIDLKVPLAWRDSLPLLTINDEIAWFVAPTTDGPKARVAEQFAFHRDQDADRQWRFTFSH